MKNGYFRLRTFTKSGLVFVLCVHATAWASSTFTWKEEVQLTDGNKIIVERTDSYDRGLRHEIGQSAPLAEHQTTFVIPGTNRKVIWRSDNRSPSTPDNLNLLALDFLAGTPYAAATISGSLAYAKWERPNPPYVFFKYVDGWKRIPLQEFPENFKINLVAVGRKKDNVQISEAIREFGFVPAQTVEKLNRQPGRGKESYAILRVPLDYGAPHSVHSGPKAPHPISPLSPRDDGK